MSSDAAPLGRAIYRVPFAVQQAKRFVLLIFGGLTLMVSVWATTMLHSSVFALEDESPRLFKGILLFFVILIVVGFNAVWWVLGRFPHALVIRERGVVLEHGSRTRAIGFDEVKGIDQRDDGNMRVYVVLVADGSEIPFGAERASTDAARLIVERSGLTWTEEPLRAERA